MRSIVAFLIEHDETTDDLDSIITNTALEYSVVDHDVLVGVNPEEDHLDRLLHSAFVGRASTSGKRQAPHLRGFALYPLGGKAVTYVTSKSLAVTIET